MSGRTSRPEFWWFALFVLAIAFGAVFEAFLDAELGQTGPILVGLIIITAAVLPLYGLVQPSQPGSNAYGPNPNEVQP